MPPPRPSTRSLLRPFPLASFLFLGLACGPADVADGEDGSGLARDRAEAASAVQRGSGGLTITGGSVAILLREVELIEAAHECSVLDEGQPIASVLLRPGVTFGGTVFDPEALKSLLPGLRRLVSGAGLLFEQEAEALEQCLTWLGR